MLPTPLNYELSGEMLFPLRRCGKLISQDYITRGNLIGKGHFGSVYEAHVQLPGEMGIPRKVAIKALIDGMNN